MHRIVPHQKDDEIVEETSKVVEVAARREQRLLCTMHPAHNATETQHTKQMGKAQTQRNTMGYTVSRVWLRARVTFIDSRSIR